MEENTRAHAPGDVTVLLSQIQNGNRDAHLQLIPLVYNELRRLAAHYMRRERPDHELQPTALVHEAYLRLVQQNASQWRNRAHFFGIAAQMMRRILVDAARQTLAAKRGGGAAAVPIEEIHATVDQNPVSLIDLDRALNKLAAIDKRQSRVVELRYFGGLTIEETAEVLGIAEQTVKLDWSMARAWLHHELTKTSRLHDNRAVEPN